MDLLANWPRFDLAAEILVAWAVWVLGGLVLMLWFTRRSRAPRHRDRFPPPPDAPARLSGVHAAARPASGVRKTSGVRTASGVRPPGAGTIGTKPASSVRVRDAYSELSTLLDSTNDPPDNGWRAAEERSLK
jgi:hypothetical protein